MNTKTETSGWEDYSEFHQKHDEDPRGVYLVIGIDAPKGIFSTVLAASSWMEDRQDENFVVVPYYLDMPEFGNERIN